MQRKEYKNARLLSLVIAGTITIFTLPVLSIVALGGPILVLIMLIAVPTVSYLFVYTIFWCVAHFRDKEVTSEAKKGTLKRLIIVVSVVLIFVVFNLISSLF